MPPVLQALLIAVLVLAGSVWLGGYVAAAVSARTTAATLQASDRIAFFRSLGRSYLRVDVPALAVGLIVGAVLLAGRGWDALAWAAVAVGAALVVVLAIAIAQARRMTVLRMRALSEPDGPIAAQVRTGAVRAAVRRAVLGVLSVALVVIGAFAAVY
ncbi:hypothetical protein [Microbacterium sp.]|uniref:hypothetical protein n=1 Tax=Microbacterium sp. TaxID=51671 RepID=UPI0037C88541